MVDPEDALDLVVEMMEAVVPAVQRTFTAPDDDWAPQLVVCREDGQPGVALGIAEPLLRGDASFVLAMRALRAQTSQIVAAALVFSAWMYEEGVRDEAGLAARAAAEPGSGAVEELVLLATARGGRRLGEAAPVIRTTHSPPDLGEWRQMPGVLGEGVLLKMMLEVVT